MVISINSNRSAQIAQQSLVERNDSIQKSTARLASGQKITSASEDAAAMAVSSGLRMDIAAFTQAQSNVAQGASMAQVAEGAMTQIGDVLARMKSLAVQASSSEISNTDRAMLDSEYQALLAEIDRVSEDTTFNGIELVKGDSVSAADLNDMGADNLLTSSAGFASFKFNDGVGDGAVKVSYDSATLQMTVVDLETGDTQVATLDPSAIATGNTEVVRFGAVGVEITLNSDFDKAADIAGADVATIVGGTGAVDNATISLTAVVEDANTPFNFGEVDDATIAVNAAVPANAAFTVTLAGTVFTASGVDLTSAGTKTVTMADVNGNSFSFDFDVTNAFDGSEAVSFELKELGQVVGSVSSSVSSSTFQIQVGTGIAGSDTITFTIDSISVNDLGLSGSSVSTSGYAKVAINAITTAIDTLSDSRASLGAAQQQMAFASQALSLTIENNTLALSDIVDVDVSSEITALTSDQTLMQAAIDMLARANERTADLLNILR